MGMGPENLADGNWMGERNLPQRTLVGMIKSDEKYLVPKGNTRLYIGDILLLLTGAEPKEAKPAAQQA